jgi:Ca2+-binding RTX toxin-like protein
MAVISGFDADDVNLGGDAGDQVRFFNGLNPGSPSTVVLTLAGVAGASGASPVKAQIIGTGLTTTINSANVLFTRAGGYLPFTVVDTLTSGGPEAGIGFDQVHLGSAGGDDLAAASDAGGVYFNAGAGNDTVNGGNGNDWIIGGTGADSLSGGAGNDVFVINGTAQFAAGEVINGGDGVDTVRYVSSINDETLQLSSSVTGIEAVQVKYGGTGTASGFKLNVNASAISNALKMTGHEGANLLVGGAGDDTIDGGAGNDILTGSQGNDMLLGGAGADQLSGGEGKDTLMGGAGADTLTGGVESDVFVFSFDDRAARDTVRDFFRSEGDVIRFEGFGLNLSGDPMATIKSYGSTATGVKLSEAIEAQIVQVNLGATAVSDADITAFNGRLVGNQMVGTLTGTVATKPVFNDVANNTAVKFIAMIINGSAPVRVVLVEDGPENLGQARVTIIGTISNLNSNSGDFKIGDFGG